MFDEYSFTTPVSGRDIWRQSSAPNSVRSLSFRAYSDDGEIAVDFYQELLMWVTVTLEIDNGAVEEYVHDNCDLPSVSELYLDDLKDASFPGIPVRSSKVKVEFIGSRISQCAVYERYEKLWYDAGYDSPDFRLEFNSDTLKDADMYSFDIEKFCEDSFKQAIEPWTNHMADYIISEGFGNAGD